MKKLLSFIRHGRVCQNVQQRIEQMELQETEKRVQRRVQELLNVM
nr:hypothetical protein [Alicyclobacillus tolerans]